MALRGQDWTVMQSVPAIAGVYAFEYGTDRKLYIGSSGNMQRRVQHHFYRLACGKHNNVYLQRAYDKHGPPSVIVLAAMPEASRADVYAEEQRWIDGFSTASPASGFNINPIASAAAANSRLSHPEWRAILQARRHGTLTDDGRTALRAYNTTRWQAGEKAFQSELATMMWQTTEHREKVTAGWDRLKEQPGALDAMRARLDANRHAPRRAEGFAAYFAARKTEVATRAGFVSSEAMMSEIIRRYGDGASIRAIAAWLGVAHNTVAHWFKECGVEMSARGTGRTKPSVSARHLAKAGHADMALFDAQVGVLYDDGHSVNAIRLEMAVSADAVRRSLQRTDCARTPGRRTRGPIGRSSSRNHGSGGPARRKNC